MSIVKLNNRSVKDITAFGSISSLGSLTHIATQTASSSSSINFTSGIDSTYKEYIFYFVNMHPATDNVKFQFQGNTAGGSGFNETMTTTSFGAGNHESNGFTIFGYEDSADQAQGTSFQNLTANSSLGNDNDQCLSGYFHLFNPSSTTFVKHFMIATQYTSSSNYQISDFIAGYFNTTSAIDEIQFKMSSGNVDAGDICLYGIN